MKSEIKSELGRHWILLRGLARESAHWGDFVSLLQSTFPDAQVSLLDLPGTGRFYQQASPCSIKVITQQVRRHAFVHGLVEQPVTLLGLSLGAMVAWEWMQTYPDDIAGAALINTSFAGLSPFYHRLRWQSYGKFFALIRQREVYSRELQTLQLVSNLPDRYEVVARAWEKIQNERPVNLKNSLRQLTAAATYRPGNKKPVQPILLLNSQQDHLVAPVCSKIIQQKWHLELRTHPWAGHDLTVDDGVWVALQLKEWTDYLRRSLTEPGL